MKTTVPNSHDPKRPEQAPLTAEQLQRQLASMQNQVYASLQDHFERARQDEATSNRGIVPWFLRRRTDLYFLITLVILGLIWFKGGGGQGSAGTSPEDTTTLHAEIQRPRLDSSKLSEVFTDSTKFHDYLTNNPLRSGAWMDSTRRAAQLDPTRISEDVRVTLDSIREKNPGNWTNSEVVFLRDALFSYAYGLWEKQNGGNAEEFRIDPAFDQFDSALVGRMVARLDLGDVVGATGAENKGFRAALVVRWMQTYSPNTTRF